MSTTKAMIKDSWLPILCNAALRCDSEASSSFVDLWTKEN